MEDKTLIEQLHNASVSRRKVLAGGLAAGAAALFAPLAAPAGAATTARSGASKGSAHAGGGTGAPAHAKGTGSSALGFAAVAASVADTVVVPTGYTTQVLIPWGDPIVPSGPTFRADGTNTAAEQAEQFGMGHDGMTFFAESRHRGLLAVNHEAADNTILFNTPPTWSPEEVLLHQNAHGIAICEVEQQGDRWTVVDSAKARRITPHTPMAFTGPAAGHAWLRTADDPTGQAPKGTLNNCANGRTPWGTYLTCEENFNGYFGAATTSAPVPAHSKEYGLSANNNGNGWYRSDTRFDYGINPNEPARFGWVVEIDPNNPTSTPKKHTALGRLKHENAEFAEAADGRAVVYTGDDQVFQHLYKYVSARPWREMFHRGENPLEDGTLYVAVFNDDGTGVWKALTPATVAGMTLAEILINTRVAADAVQATEMDRPEWVAVHPTLPGVAYGTFTNNSGRTTTSAANPRKSNRHGHILRWQGANGDHGATDFVWSIYLLAGRGSGTGDESTVAPGDFFGSPDGLAFDIDGRLWIQTDGTQPRDNVPGAPALGNNQMLVSDPQTGDLRRFLVGPKGCEITGWTMTPDQRTLFVNVQHPGENASAYGSPTAESTWPNGSRPRSATVAIRRVDGGPVGAP